MKETTGKTCILVCEDEMFVAMMLEDRLKDAGYRVLMAPRVARGMELAETETIDIGLLDINMDGEDSFPVAEKLRSRHIPFLFSSGYGDECLPEPWRSEKVLQKPYDTKTVIAALESVRTT